MLLKRDIWLTFCSRRWTLNLLLELGYILNIMAGMFSKVKSPFATTNTSNDAPTEEKVKKSDDEGESLVTVLATDEDRSALTLLVADCTEVMRKSIVDIFDAKATGNDDEQKTNQEPLTGDQALLNPELDPGTVDVPAMDKAKKDLETREKELSGEQMQDLKKAALAYFDDWRDRVILRVGEIVNSKEAAEKQKEAAKPKTETTRTASPMRFKKGPQYHEAVGEALRKLYPAVENPLKKLPEDKKALVLHSMLLLMLSLENYQAHSRTLMLYLTTSLGLPIDFLAEDESKVARGLLTAAENMKADEETKKRAEENSSMRKWKVGLASVAGAALIGVTGGLAAPLLAAGLGSVMGGLGLGATAAAGYLGTLAGSSVLVGGLFGAYGGRMTGKMMDQYAREVEDFAFVPIAEYHKPRKIELEYRRLRVAVGVSGWLTNQDEVVEPWKVIGPGMESFALRFELEAMMNLGNSLTSMIKSAAWGYAKTEIIKRTVFASLMAGLWPLALLKVSRVIDNPWSVASYRASRAGEVMADALINKAQGERPVTLVGYSLGARVIFSCLQTLAQRKAFGLVESVVLIGAPTPSTSSEWRMMRSVVSGRLVNVYSTNDYILAFLYRSSSIQYGVAGLQAIPFVKGVENVDVSDMVSGHTSYRYLTGRILKQIGFEDVNMRQLEKEEQRLKEAEETEEKERQVSEQKEEAQEKSTDASATEATTTVENTKPGAADDKAAAEKDRLSAGVPLEKVPSKEVSDQHIKDLEKEIELKNKTSYIGWATEKMTVAGTNTAVAYEKAKAQWKLRRQGAGGQAAAGVASDADKATGDVSKTAGQAGVDTPKVGDVAYQGMKARSDARKAGI